MVNQSVVDLSIVIVNYNTRQLLLELLESIYSSKSIPECECIVVDNGSADDSVVAVQKAFPQVRIVANSVGRYYSAGNNQGIAIAQGRYVLVLSPDMVVLGKTLSQLVQQMDAAPEIGAATTTMYFPDMELQYNCCREVTFPYLMFEYTFIGKLFSGRLKTLREWLWYGDWDRLSQRKVGVLPGSCIIAPKHIWDEVNGFEESMPMYFSDNYLTRSVARLGKDTVYLMSDGVIHYEGASTQEKRILTRRYLNMYFNNLLAYVRLVFGRLAQMVFFLLLLPTWIIQLLKAHG